MKYRAEAWEVDAEISGMSWQVLLHFGVVALEADSRFLEKTMVSYNVIEIMLVSFLSKEYNYECWGTDTVLIQSIA